MEKPADFTWVYIGAGFAALLVALMCLVIFYLIKKQHIFKEKNKMEREKGIVPKWGLSMSDLYAGSDKKACELPDVFVIKEKNSSDDKKNDTEEMQPFDTVRLALQLDFTAKMAAAIESSSKNSYGSVDFV